MNPHFRKPLRDEFFREVGEAVRFGKQRLRNIAKRANEGDHGRRQRLRREAEEHLLEAQGNVHNAVDADDDDDNHESN